MVVLPNPSSDKDGRPLEEIRTSLIDVRAADIRRPASLSTILGVTGRRTLRPPSTRISKEVLFSKRNQENTKTRSGNRRLQLREFNTDLKIFQRNQMSTYLNMHRKETRFKVMF